MKCFECDKTVQVQKYRAWMYPRVGVSNVCLLNQRVEICTECSRETPIIRSIGKLHRAIGIAIALQPAELSGEDLRFLRRNAGLLVSQMATRLGVAEGTYSKWENNKRPLTHTQDKLARLTYLTMRESENPVEYSKHIRNVIQMELPLRARQVIALDAENLDVPARYLPESDELFSLPEAVIVSGNSLPWDQTSLDTVVAVASVDEAPTATFPGGFANVCDEIAFTA